MTTHQSKPFDIGRILNNTIGLSILAAVLVPLGLAGAFWWNSSAKERQIDQLEAKLEEQRAAFESEIGRILGEERRAQFRLVGREERDGKTWSTIRFVEFFEAEGKETTFDRVFELPGTEVYIDSLVVKFENETVREGDARNFSVFRRAFSDQRTPEEGEPLYLETLRQAGKLAQAEAPVERASDAQKYLKLLQHYIENPEVAAAEGVRMIEGQANYTNPRKGYYYELVQQASGGLSIVEKKIPEVLN